MNKRLINKRALVTGGSRGIGAAIEQTVKKFGGIDILANNAGSGMMMPIDEFRLEDFDRTLM